MDPLEALFRFRPEMELATEESYLQGLTERDRQEEDLRQWLTFTLGSEEYALDIGQIREIIKPREITDLPRVPDFILGIISLRGVIIPVFDLKRRLKLGTAEITSASRIIVCQYGEKSAGLVVDSLNQVVRLPAQGIEPPPAVLSGLDRDMVEGVGRDQGRMMILLDLANVLNAELI
jgi:purine-binding chemotaxis protein CheW